MNIKNKLISSYLVMTLLTIGIGFFSIKLIHLIEMRYVEISDETIPMIESIQELRFASLRLVASTTEAMLIRYVYEGNEANKALNTEKDLIRSGINNYESALIKYEHYIKLFPDEQALFDIIKENGQLLIAGSGEMMEAITKGVSDSEIYELKEKFEKYEQDTLKAIDAALTYEEHEINERKESVKSILRNSIYAILLICSISFIVAIVFGFVSAGFVSRPIRKLVNVMKEVGKGNLAVKSDIKSTDEIGQLSVSFNEMTTDLENALNSSNQEKIERKQAEDKLNYRMKEFDRVNMSYVDRELRIVELKKQIRELETVVRHKEKLPR